ncbi:hypothetical protein BV22DRAFT_1135525 [Leucogyrophana mollusca]|uniref:Uncharacterized protein n=1 Tax=Leucogyrophana mollusca TaxID=85980 RepID=A0ACB8AW74_9AGAM|nr:hypothetical protein BV22DRAFT_1135525 [Leucogyrophana mollusca]
MVQDIKERKTLARVDDAFRQRKITISRSLIYDRGYGIRSNAVENLLKEQSLVPTSNTFSEKLGPLGFNFFSMLVVDLLHEFELGVWKALFIHLLRILTAAGPGDALVHELDRRLVPTFGRDTIRKFASNTSELKKLAARDFEDLLQCAIPVFDALLPEPHNRHVSKLLFLCAYWHALAKLRLHTDETLDLLDAITTSLGKNRSVDSAACRELLEATYKLHALGDYATTIRRFGTTDSYSTELGELEHRTSKKRYCRTDRKQFVEQITRIERREARIQRIRDKRLSRVVVVEEAVARTPEAHFHVAKSQNYPENICLFLRKHTGDPAIKDFMPKLQQHLLSRVADILSKENGPRNHLSADAAEPVPNLEGSVFIKSDRMYRHSLMRINYTTYDVRRAQDVINPSTSHCNIMLLSNTTSSGSANHHAYLYARVLGIYHVNAVYIGPGMVDYRSHRIDFLWVRWYQCVNEASGWDSSSLDRLRFPPTAEEDAFGFVDPDDVLRGCHVVPQFSQGLRHLDGVGISPCAHDHTDYQYYFVNRYVASSSIQASCQSSFSFVDRDMFMRYHWGMGIGHTHTHDADQTAGTPPPEASPTEVDPSHARDGTHSGTHPATAALRDDLQGINYLFEDELGLDEDAQSDDGAVAPSSDGNWSTSDEESEEEDSDGEQPCDDEDSDVLDYSN